jgi:glycosyltransferase involved in cell wall biosynthesis
MMNWGTSEDINQSRRLVQELQIDRNVEWLDPVSKPRLIQLYNRSDAVFDQFMVGSYGTTAIEAMACARPVVMYLEKYWNTKCYGEVAPVLNAQTADEIFGAMVALTDERYRQKVGLDARNYVVRHHGPEVIAEKYMQLYREVLE